MLSVAFDLVDKDGSGYVDADEMEGMIKVCALTFTMCGCTNPRQCKHSVFAQCQMSPKQCLIPFIWLAQVTLKYFSLWVYDQKFVKRVPIVYLQQAELEVSKPYKLISNKHIISLPTT